MATLIFYTQEISNGHGDYMHWKTVKSKSEKDARYADYLGDMLSTEIDSRAAVQVMSRLEDVESGHVATAGFNGDEWTLHITQAGVRLEHQTLDDLQHEQEGRFSLREFKAALTAWMKFLKSDSHEPVEVDI